MKLIYIAGPYKAATPYETLCNILAARERALDVWELGGAALCPHSNTALFDGARGIPDATWYTGYAEMLLRCDAVYTVPGWERSIGATEEINLALRHAIPVLHTKSDLIAFLGAKE